MSGGPVLVALLCVAGAWVMGRPPPAARRLAALADVAAPGRSADLIGRWCGAKVQPAVSSVLATLRSGRDQRRWEAAVIELCDGLVAELAAGRGAETALAASIGMLDPEVKAALCTATGPAPGEVPSSRGGEAAAARTVEVPHHEVAVWATVFDECAAVPGAGGLRLLAACLRLSAERGGALGTVLDGLARALRDERDQRREVTAQLAGPRATARLLAVLPLLGLAMAAALGARPLAFLFGTVPGWFCLCSGTGLDLLGLWWTRRLAAAAVPTR